MDPPSVGSTVGHRYGLGSARLLLFWLPPVSSLAPPSSPPWSLSARSPLLVKILLRARAAPSAFREGGVMSRPWTVFVVFLLHVYSVT